MENLSRKIPCLYHIFQNLNALDREKQMLFTMENLTRKWIHAYAIFSKTLKESQLIWRDLSWCQYEKQSDKMIQGGADQTH